MNVNGFRGGYPLLAIVVLLVATPLLVAATTGKSSVGRVTAVTCGQTVTTSIVLANDLTGCIVGLKVGANGITINLNGHSVVGSGGITGVVDAAHIGVTLENGTISGFDEGVDFDSGANGSRIQGLHLTGNKFEGVFVASSNGVVVSGNYAVSDGTFGIFVSQGKGDQITGNWLEANGDGIDIDGPSSAALVSQNRALDNGIGIFVTALSTGQVSGNVANGNTNDGIETTGGGIAVTLNGNRASFNGAFGIDALPGQKDGGGNVVQDNANAKQCANVVCAEVSS